jgi:hypothetical protein
MSFYFSTNRTDAIVENMFQHLYSSHVDSCPFVAVRRIIVALPCTLLRQKCHTGNSKSYLRQRPPRYHLPFFTHGGSISSEASSTIRSTELTSPPVWDHGREIMNAHKTI